MRLIVYLSLMAVVLHHAHSIYVALAPNKFYLDQKYAVQLTINALGSAQTTVEGTIFPPGNENAVVGRESITLSNGRGILEIPVGKDVPPSSGGLYTLELSGSGGLTFTNSTNITLSSVTFITFIQTDRALYKAGQLVRFRVLTVDKDLKPQKVPKTIRILNPGGSTVAKFNDDGTKGVYTNTYQLVEFPDLGSWKIVVESLEFNIDETQEIKVDEYVLPKFEVSAEIDPKHLVKQHRDEKPAEKMKVTLKVKAMYTYGKGVTGDVKVTVQKPESMYTYYNREQDKEKNRDSQIIQTSITNPNGQKDVLIDLIKEFNEGRNMYAASIPMIVEVTDETRRTYNTTVKLPVEEKPVKLEFDEARSEKIFRRGMPLQVVVKLTDAGGEALKSEYLNDNPLRLTLRENGRTINSKDFMLDPEQTEVMWNIDRVDTGASSVYAEAAFDLPLMAPNGREFKDTYTASSYIEQYQTIGNATMNARWAPYSELMIGGDMSFTVNVSNPADFSTIVYMIVSRGNIQTFGPVQANGKVNLEVTTEMCPNGKLVVYGITAVSGSDEVPEIIADTLNIKVKHCQEKKVTPSSPTKSARTGTDVQINMDVSWTDGSKQDAVGEHDFYMLAVDKSIIALAEQNDIDSDVVEEQLNKFSLGSDTNGGVHPIGRFKRTVMPPWYSGGGKTTGELLKTLGLKLVGNIQLKDKETFDYYYNYEYLDGEVMYDEAEDAFDQDDALAGTVE